ncbi:LPS export ABC transporter permease LptG [Pseudoduganella namucuonensis]|uniref:Lipopolysaccharide export system permease protein n=1 Tax=Pseudoduganella namucuonensis TaxID=1035707 RepID=A0A1I7LYS0_9BURK|nr:LPS export ABC transporter permease LptG [Pseudoduganella namucuonensis]SFV14747.1 lipopolysaccharide export system permease protein [Pseudoduganella namucuonensis]
MSILQRYFASSIAQSVAFVLLAFLALAAFMDLTAELPSVGKNGYGLQHALLYVLILLPERIYRVLPVAALIGTIYTMAQFASSSEFTIMRASSMSTRMAAGMLFRVGAVIVAVAFLFGEVIVPRTSPVAEKVKLTAQGAAVSAEFRSGLWTKDIIKSEGLTGTVLGSRFFNVREARPDGQLLDVKLYEFDTGFRLSSLIQAKRATYQGNSMWRLYDVTENRFSNPALAAAGGVANAENHFAQETSKVETVKMATRDLVSEITPKIMSVSRRDPERMSANELAVYTRHLAENRQETHRFKIAFWKKLFDPLAIFVLMGLALPFAYLHARSGGVSLKIFVGIMIGISFMLINTLFSHIGMLSTWPPVLTAAAPSLLFLLLAIGALWWVERH